MRTALYSGALVVCLSGFASISEAATLIDDNFDSYTTQAAFEAAWPIVAAPSGVLVSTQSVSSANSIYYGANTSNVQRNGHSFAESGNPALNNIVKFSFDFFDSNAAASPYRQYANLQDGTAPSASGQLVSMGLNNNLLSTAEGGNFYMARILGYTPPGLTSGAYFKLNNDPSLLRTTGWHNLGVEISDVDFKFYVDGFLAETVPQTGLTLRSYDVVRLGSGLASTQAAWFDNVSVVTLVPEPSSLALALLGGFGLFLARVRR